MEAATAACAAGAVMALVTAGSGRLSSQEIKELVTAALTSLISHPAVADAAVCPAVLLLMSDVLRSQPPASLAVAALHCACMLLYARGDMCQLAAENGLLQTLQALRCQDYGDEFEALSMNADAAMLHYTCK